MEITVSCPSCGVAVTATGEDSVARGKCTSCGRTIRVRTCRRASVAPQRQPQPDVPHEANSSDVLPQPRPPKQRSRAAVYVALAALILITAAVAVVTVIVVAKRVGGERAADGPEPVGPAAVPAVARPEPVGPPAAPPGPASSTTTDAPAVAEGMRAELPAAEEDEILLNLPERLAARTPAGPPPEPVVADESAEPPPGSLASVDVIKQLREQCDEWGWAASTAEQYAEFQKLARYVAAAHFMMDDESVPEGLRVVVNAEAQKVLEQLSRRPWPPAPAIESTNRLAAAGLAQPGDGIFAYLEVTMPPRTIEGNPASPLAVFRLIGTSKRIAMTIRESAPQLRVGTRWLVLGMHDPTIEFVSESGSEDIISLVKAKYLVEEPKLVGE